LVEKRLQDLYLENPSCVNGAHTNSGHDRNKDVLLLIERTRIQRKGVSKDTEFASRQESSKGHTQWVAYHLTDQRIDPYWGETKSEELQLELVNIGRVPDS